MTNESHIINNSLLTKFKKIEKSTCLIPLVESEERQNCCEREQTSVEIMKIQNVLHTQSPVTSSLVREITNKSKYLSHTRYIGYL